MLTQILLLKDALYIKANVNSV